MSCTEPFRHCCCSWLQLQLSSATNITLRGTNREGVTQVGLWTQKTHLFSNVLWVSWVSSRRKTQTNASRSKPQMGGAVSPYAVQGPYAFSDITKLDGGPPADVMSKYPGLPTQLSQCNDYENVPCPERESCFVTNDIYESSKAQSRRGRSGWVENEIYG